MKNKALSASALLAGILTIGLVSCDSDNKSAATPAATQAATSGDANATAPSLNIRYIDGDSIARRYQGSLDYEAEHMKAMRRLDNAQRGQGKRDTAFCRLDRTEGP